MLSLDLFANIARRHWPTLAVVAGRQRGNITPQYCIDIEMARIPILAKYSCAVRFIIKKPCDCDTNGNIVIRRVRKSQLKSAIVYNLEHLAEQLIRGLKSRFLTHSPRLPLPGPPSWCDFIDLSLYVQSIYRMNICTE